MQNIDYFIIGGGIAGVTLAHQLARRGLSFHLYQDNGHSSSRVAAGLFNPITGRKMVKTWKADLLFPYLLDFYRNAEKITKSDFLYEKAIYRPFLSIEEQNDWVARSSDPAFARFIKKVFTNPQFEGKFRDPFGGLSLNFSGWLDIGKYIDQSIKYFSSLHGKAVVHTEHFDNTRLQTEKDYVIYKNVRARNLIFSEGVGLKNNPFFNWLPLQPLKGEILDVKLPFLTNEIINRGVFVLPIRGNIFRVGSTYEHFDTSWEKTEGGKQQLIDKLRGVMSSEFEVMDHAAGIRPSTKDRRPLLGRHPKHNNILIFNGLGTKGVALAPYFAEMLISHVEKENQLEAEANIQRFFSLYCT